MILSGWKDVAKYLGCGVRTAQRWEIKGMPVLRPTHGKRSHVLVDSSQLDSWLHEGASHREGPAERLDTVQRTRKLRDELQLLTKELNQTAEALRREITGLKARRRQS